MADKFVDIGKSMTDEELSECANKMLEELKNRMNARIDYAWDSLVSALLEYAKVMDSITFVNAGGESTVINLSSISADKIGIIRVSE